MEKDRAEHLILEHAILHIKPGESSRFELAMKQAAPLIAASPGFLGLEVRPQAEGENSYLLLVRWESIAAHRDGFRKSDRYQKWRALLHHFYEPFPTVRYYAEPLEL